MGCLNSVDTGANIHTSAAMSKIIFKPLITLLCIADKGVIAPFCEDVRLYPDANLKYLRKVGDGATADPEHRAYLSYMTLPNSRTWMRVRTRSIKGVKVNNKRSFSKVFFGLGS